MNEEFSPSMGFDVNAFNSNGFAHVKYGSDNALFVEFYDREVFKPEQKNAEGEVIKAERLESEIYCRIEAPGDKLSKWDQPARESDKARFPRQWGLYQRGVEGASAGTPLSELKDLPRDLEGKLRYHSIHSLEQIALMNDAMMSGLGLGARELRVRAQKRLQEKAAQVSAEAFMKSEEEKKALLARIEALEAGQKSPAKNTNKKSEE